MEIAPIVDARNSAAPLLQILDSLAHLYGVKDIPPVGVRGSYDVGGSSLSRQPDHRQSFFTIPRPIVEIGKNVAVDVDHEMWAGTGR